MWFFNRFNARRWLSTTIIFVVLLGQISFFARLSWDSSELNFPSIARDIDTIDYWANQLQLNLLLVDPLLLPSVVNSSLRLDSSTFCNGCESTILLVCDFNDVEKIQKLLARLKCQGFKGGLLWSLSNENLTLGAEINRVATVIIAFLRTREANTWWTGASTTREVSYRTNRKSVSLSRIFQEEKLLDKFEVTHLTINTRYKQFLYPKDVRAFLKNFETAKFIPCNERRADIFYKKYGKDLSPKAKKFRHRSWKLISRVKNVFDRLGVTFWISSGTCLGYFRECDIIAHSRDVDIGVFAKDFRQDIVTDLEKEKIRLTHFFGEVNDSLELSFLDQNNVKLDIFFFYKENDTYWNGGTQARTGKKFKYVFPKFELCWTFFLDLKLRVPCDTEAYIYANYGPTWNEQIKEWDWKKSPFNVQENGYWPQTKRNFFV